MCDPLAMGQGLKASFNRKAHMWSQATCKQMRLNQKDENVFFSLLCVKSVHSVKNLITVIQLLFKSNVCQMKDVPSWDSRSIL